MDKIVIMADHSGEIQKLDACLRMLFPECKIEIISKRTERLRDISLAPGAAYRDEKGKKNGKYSDYR